MKSPERKTRIIEVLIQAFCVQGGFELVLNDRDFDAKKELLGRELRRA